MRINFTDYNCKSNHLTYKENLKNTDTKKAASSTFAIDENEIKKEIDKNDKNNALIIGSSIALAVLLPTAYFLISRGKGGKGYQSETLNDFISGGFRSLKDDTKIPTLDSCKSINEKLRNLLKEQVALTNASTEDLEKLGMTKTSKKILLCGPAGVGKTHFAKIYAKTLNADYMEVSYGDLNKRYTGEHIENIKNIFEEIIKTADNNKSKQYVVTFNEIDAIIVPHQGLVESGGGHITFKKEERNLFLNYLDEISRRTSNITVIGTTNSLPNKYSIDEAALSRFGTKMNVDYPDKNCLYEALKAHLTEIAGDKFITENDAKISDFAEKLFLRKASFRNLDDIVEGAKHGRLNHYMTSGETKFKFEFLENAEKACEVTDGEASGVAKAA